MEDALRRQHAAAGGVAGIATAPRRMVVSWAGDIKGLQQLGGTAGASGTYNCLLCEAVLHQTYRAGVPHLRELPEPWASKDKRPPEIINPPPRGGTAAIAEQARLWAVEQAKPNAPKTLSSGEARFKSCIHEPLFRSNNLTEHVSRTPLHVSLGLGTTVSQRRRCAQPRGCSGHVVQVRARAMRREGCVRQSISVMTGLAR